MEEENILESQREFSRLRAMYRSGKISKITSAERELLEFCHGRDMIAFLREEFRRNPILYDENGEVIENPKYTVGGCPDSFFCGETPRTVIHFDEDGTVQRNA